MAYGPETLAARGGDGTYTWGLGSGSGPLPTGLSMSADGDVTGTPTAVETVEFAVQVVSGDGQTADRTFTITVFGQPVLLPAELCAANAAYAIATFGDANLEAAIRAALGLGALESLTCERVLGCPYSMHRAWESRVSRAWGI